MNPKQRRIALFEKEPIDRMPVYLFHGTYGAKITNQSYRASEASAEGIAKKEIECFNRYHCDNISVNFGLQSMGRALGAQLDFHEETSPTVEVFPLEAIDQIDQLDFSLLSLERTDFIQMHLKAIEAIQKGINDQAVVDYELTGPLTAASSIYAPEKLLKATRKNKEQVHSLLDQTTLALERLIEEMAAENPDLGFSITDPVSSGDLISPRQYKEFTLPYLKRLVDKIHQLGQTVTLHICGNALKNIPYIIEAGVDIFSIDQKVSLLDAAELAGNQLIIAGHVNPIECFFRGTPDQVRQAVEECFEQMQQTNTPFIIAPGCSVPYGTPEANVSAYMEAALTGAERMGQHG